MVEKVNIRPRVSILSVLKHLNYKPWYALAEFVDNAIDSYHKEKESLRKLDPNYRLHVKIDINTTSKKITIKDNAAGIHKSEFSRAFKTAEVPPDQTGLSEFGMGMKSASCWFTNRWSVRTKSINDKNEYEVTFDISKIVNNQVEELIIEKKDAKREKHYTIIELYQIHNVPVKKTLGKIKDHLQSIYRQFLRDEEIIIEFNGEPLKYSEPAILLAPYYKETKGMSFSWRKEINIDLDGKHKITGFAALRETGSTADAGFALLRRKRVIQGSNGEGYRPEQIFGHSNSYTYQRLFGELNLTGFSVSHTKDGIKWDGLEEKFISELKKELKKDPDFIAQAEGYRKRPKATDYKKAIDKPLTRTTNVLKREGTKIIEDLRTKELDTSPISKELPQSEESIHKVILIELKGEEWSVHLDLSFDETIRDWIDIGDNYIDERLRNKEQRVIGIRLSLAHPFMTLFANSDKSNIEPFLRIAAAFGIAETISRESGVRHVNSLRRNLNELLYKALSAPE